MAYGLKKEYAITFSEDMLTADVHGKPRILEQPSVHFNISHSDCLVICGFAPVEIGIDVQKHKKVRFEAILKRTVPEDLAGEILHGENPEEAFFTQWVLREAYIKWIGDGFSKDLRTIDFKEGWHSLLEVAEGYSGAIWSSRKLEVEWNYVPMKALMAEDRFGKSLLPQTEAYTII